LKQRVMENESLPVGARVLRRNQSGHHAIVQFVGRGNRRVEPDLELPRPSSDFLEGDDLEVRRRRRRPRPHERQEVAARFLAQGLGFFDAAGSKMSEGLLVLADADQPVPQAKRVLERVDDGRFHRSDAS
jgi:hypothetical protein